MPDTASSKTPLKTALIYDFDGTLARGNMQEVSFIPSVGMDIGAFWGEAERLTKDADGDGILMYMQLMLHHARRAARFGGDDDELIPLAEQDRRLWDANAIAEGTAILQAALARDQLGEYQAQAAVLGGRRSAGPLRPPA